MLLPIGVEGHALRRIPYVSITIAAICVLLFLVTWVFATDPLGPSDDRYQPVLDYWEQHPNTQLPESFLRELRSTHRAQVEIRHENAVERLGPAAKEAQDRLDALVEAAGHTQETLLRRLALIPKRGVAQIGWLTHMFVHLGWLHLLGNLLFFYLTALLLEDAWGRPLFAAFYLAGGLVGGIAHFLANPHSAAVMAGASGAVAACMGAFAVRYAMARVRITYLFFAGFRLLRGTFRVPAWLAAGAWGGWELVKLLTGGEEGVAVAAHVGGFLFGLGAAAVIRTAGIEQKFVGPGIEANAVAWQRPQQLDLALEAFSQGDFATARRHAGGVLKAQPTNTEAEFLLYRIDLAQGLTGAAAGRLDRLVARLLDADWREELFVLVTDEAQKVPADAFRPVTAFKIAEALETYQGITPRDLEPLYAVASRAEGPIGAMALVRRAEFALDEGQPLQARDLMQRVSVAALPPDWAERFETLERRLAAMSMRLLSALPADFGVPHAPRIVTGIVVGATEQGLLVRNSNGQVAKLGWQRIVAVAAALTPSEGPGGVRLVPTTDLVLAWGSNEQGAQVLRLSVKGLGLGMLFPGVPPKVAYARWLQTAVERSGAMLLPDAQAISRGEYPRFASLESMNQALYGATPLF